MITLRRAKERHHVRRKKQDVWVTFHPEDRADPFADGFGALEILNEGHLSPGARTPRKAPRDAEILTYVREGAVAYEDSRGRSGVIHAGEFQRMGADSRIRHSETNASLDDWAHLFQIWLHPSEARVEPVYQQKRFSAAERRSGLCVIASPDARRGSLRIHQDAVVYSALLYRGQHLAHELLPGRSAWLHVVHGELTVAGVVLTTGDGAGFTTERVVSLTAREESEILLLDLGEPLPKQRNELATPEWFPAVAGPRNGRAGVAISSFRV